MQIQWLVMISPSDGSALPPLTQDLKVVSNRVKIDRKKGHAMRGGRKKEDEQSLKQKR